MLPERIANLLVGYDIHRCSRDNSVMEFREKRDSETESEERAPTHAPTRNVGAVPRVLMLSATARFSLCTQPLVMHPCIRRCQRLS
jgi:hypothetical protein